jgi:acetyl esterase/lipase
MARCVRCGRRFSCTLSEWLWQKMLTDGMVLTVGRMFRNHQLTHPLVSPALGYLGGLPPLFVLASDKEVLRDEIIYVYVLRFCWVGLLI